MKNKAFVIVGVIVTLLAGILNGQTPVEIRAASSTAVSGWQQMSSPGGDAVVGGADRPSSRRRTSSAPRRARSPTAVPRSPSC